MQESFDSHQKPTPDARIEHATAHDAADRRPLWRRVLPYLLVLAVLVVILMGMSLLKQEPEPVAPPPSGLVVETARAERVDHEILVNSQGLVQPRREIALVPEIQGKIISLSDQFVVGGTFSAGEVLVRIDPADYQVAVERAQAALASQRASLELEQARSDQARKDWQSFGKQQKPNDLVLNIPQLKGAQAAVEAAQADLRKARRDLEKTEIRAPFDGVVTSKAADLGQFVTIGSGLGRIAGSALAEVRLPLTDSDMQKIDWPEGTQNWDIPVRFTDGKDLTASGKLVRMEASKDSNTLVNYAVAQIQQPFEQGLKLNAFLQAEISGRSLRNVLRVPVSYIMPDQQIGIYADDNTLKIKRFSSPYQTDTHVYIDSGLEAQDVIVATPIQGAYDGMPLRRPDTAAERELADE